MDLTKIKTAIINQLSNLSGIESLKVQNHIYGCFIIMEDIAEPKVDVSGTIISTPKFIFDFDKQFDEIGIRYGFIMDTKLILDSFNQEYKNVWIEYFKSIDLTQDIKEVDKIEDCLIETIQSITSAEDAFFINSLETGSLSHEWLDKVINLLNPKKILPPPPPPSPSSDEDKPIVNNEISKAVCDKPIHNKKRGLAITRRNVKILNSSEIIQKKSRLLGKTRRHI